MGGQKGCKMFGTIKSYLTIISLVIAVLSSGYGIFMKIRADILKEERNNAYDELEVKTTEVTKYKNELGQEVTRTIEYSKKLSELKDSKDSIEQRLYQTISASNLKEKQLQKALAIELTSTNSKGYDSVALMEINDIVVESASFKMEELEPIRYGEIRYFDDGFLKAVSYPDSLSYTYSENINIITAKRMIDRKFFLWKWIGWQKMIDRDLVEIVSDNPNSSINGRMIKIKN